MKKKAHRTIINRLAVLLLVFTTGGFCQAKTLDASHWVGTWGASVQKVEQKLVPPGFKSLVNTTIRQIVHVSIGGKQLRVRIANTFADWNDNLTISAVNVALSPGGNKIETATLKPVLFNGHSSVTIPYGVLMVSDPVNFNLPAGTNLVVTMHVEHAPKRISGHRSARGAFAFLQKGDEVAAPELSSATKSGVWYYLGGVDVLAPASSEAVVCLGDSITDGKGSMVGKNRRWPDLLAQRLRNNPDTSDVGVLNEGIGGNCLWSGGIGQTALQRQARDALSQPGVRWLIVFEGINDLGGGKVTAAELILAYKQLIIRAHECGLRVYGATITPCGNSFYYTPKLEAERQQLNHWIRTSGAFDGVLDFDVVVRNPDNPKDLLPSVDCGDHLHMNDKGYQMLANSVNLKLFTH